jgi:hypothetical protein
VKKIPLLITIGVTLLLVGGYYLYEKVLLKKPLETWDLIPEDAVLVYEKDNCLSCIENVGQSSIWKAVKSASIYSKDADTLRSSLQQLIQDQKGLLVSLHTTKKDDFDFVFYVPGKNSLIESLQQKDNLPGYRHSKREFNSIQIHEVSFSKQVFSWTILEDVWIGSFTPFLIEDVIRTFKAKKQGFKKELVNFQSISRVSGDAGNLYINVRHLYDLLTVFSSDVPSAARSFGKFTILDIKADNNTLFLNGFSTDSINQSNYMLSIFRNQSPVPFDLKHIVSNRAVMFNSYGISNGESFYNDRNSFVKKHRGQRVDSLQQLTKSLNIDLPDLYKSIHDEVGVCFLESSKGSRFSKVLIIKSDKPSQWLSAFDKLSQKLSVDTIFYERYGDYEIREVPIYNFPEKLFWPLVSGFTQSFYTVIGNTILVGDNLEELKKFLTDIDDEDTWGKSVTHNKFLKTTLLESNISLYINTPKIWGLLSPSLQPRWKQHIKENQKSLRAIQLGAIQFSHLNNNYYTNVSWNFNQTSENQKENKRDDKFVTSFSSGISRLHAVKSHVNRSDEMLIQDSLNDLSLVTNEGKVLWKLPIGDRIVSEVHQIDFFSNGKLQYFFTTRDAIHIIDRLGNYVEPYPRQLPFSDIEYASIIDWDHSKKYRFLITDSKGKLWMYDKEGNNLEGWNPKDIGESLSLAPEHHRIKGKDYVLAIRDDGRVYLMNRRGEDVKHFPLNLEAKVAGDYFLDLGAGISDTYFVVVSRDGYRIKFNPEGKIQSRETLVKTSFNTQFKLISEKANKSYLIVQQDSKQFTVQDEALRKIISNEFTGSNPVKINYYDFGSGRVYISVTDLSQELTYIYDEQGTLLTTPPLESSMIEIRPLDSERALIFFSQGNAVTVQPL